MKIAIFIDNMKIPEVDCRDLTKGNPGIGGTEYTILFLAQMYKQYFPENEVVLLAKRQAKLPTVDSVEIVEDAVGAIRKAAGLRADILLISAVEQGQPLSEKCFRLIDELQIKTIVWGHNFYLSDFCRRVSRSKYVKANVFVGRQQYDRYIDHKIVKKSTYIYNMYPEVQECTREHMSNHVVTYVGSLVPMKGFHLLAKAWKQVLEKVPDAELMVIGSGKLYGRGNELGRFGIAAEEYENQFMKDLLDEDGNILASVHFLGVMGSEKKDVILNTAVGVPNPSGRTETFGISALDFEALGVPVVTIAKGGFLDTVIDHKTGYLYTRTSDLAECIVSLLSDVKSNECFGEAGVEFVKNFAPTVIVKQWNELFEKVYQGADIIYLEPDSFMNNNLKKYRFLNRKIKNKLACEYPISVIGVETIARKMLRMIGK